MDSDGEAVPKETILFPGRVVYLVLLDGSFLLTLFQSFQRHLPGAGAATVEHTPSTTSDFSWNEQNGYLSVSGRCQRFKVTICSVTKTNEQTKPQKTLLCSLMNKEISFEGVKKTPSVNPRVLCVAAPKVNSNVLQILHR